MPRKKRDVSRVLQKKGFKIDISKDHDFYYLYNSDGKKSTIYTKISHGSDNEIHEGLLGEMRRQIGLSKKDFNRYMDCTMSKEEYLSFLSSQGKYY